MVPQPRQPVKRLDYDTDLTYGVTSVQGSIALSAGAGATELRRAVVLLAQHSDTIAI